MEKTLAQIWKEDNKYEMLGDIAFLQGRIGKANRLYKAQARQSEDWARDFKECNIKIDAIERFVQAAQNYEKCGNPGNALTCYREAEEIAKIARPLEEVGGYYFEMCYDPEEVPLKVKALEDRLTWLEQVTRRSSEQVTLGNKRLSKPIRIKY